jgi:Uma2 family endonuclease
MLRFYAMGYPASSGMTPDAFLAWEREQVSERHHYLRGELFAMSGGSARHSFLGAQLIRLLGQGVLGGPCQAHTSDLRLGLGEEFFVYADAVIVCRPIAFRPGTTDVVTNPRVVVEVLSKSTEAYDRGDKLAGYLALTSLDHILLVSQRQARVESYARRRDGSFHFEVHAASGKVALAAIDMTLSIDEVYEGAFDLPGDL